MSCKGCPKAGNCSKSESSCQVKPNPDNHIKHIAAIMSGKGGVGKSTVTVLLARAMKRMGLNVGIMDADITGPSIPRLMGLEDEKAYANDKHQIIPVENSEGIKIMSLNYLLASEADPVIWRGPIVSGVVKQLYTDVLWGDLDVLLIDMPPGTGDVALTILQELPVEGVVMVSTPQPMVTMIVEKAVRMCAQMNIPVLGVVENMAYMTCPHCDERIEFYSEEEIHELAAKSNVKMLAELPMNDSARKLNDFDSLDLKKQEELLKQIEPAAKEIAADLDRLKINEKS